MELQFMCTRRNAPLVGFVSAAVALVSSVIAGSPAGAVTINVGGSDWNVTATDVPGSINVDTFRSTYISSQPWNGNENTAREFATALAGQLGYPNPPAYSPLFVYSELAPPPGSGQTLFNAAGSISTGGVSTNFQLTYPTTTTYSIATATQVNADPVPGPLPVIGGVAAFGWSRRLRRRISLAPRP